MNRRDWTQRTSSSSARTRMVEWRKQSVRDWYWWSSPSQIPNLTQCQTNSFLGAEHLAQSPSCVWTWGRELLKMPSPGLNIATGDTSLTFLVGDTCQYSDSSSNTHYANLRRKNGHAEPYGVKVGLLSRFRIPLSGWHLYYNSTGRWVSHELLKIYSHLSDELLGNEVWGPWQGMCRISILFG